MTSSNTVISGKIPVSIDKSKLLSIINTVSSDENKILIHFGAGPVPSEKNCLIFRIIPAAAETVMKQAEDEIILYQKPQFELAEEIVSIARFLDSRTGINPLSGLPGNIKIKKNISEIISGVRKAAVAYFDISDFKAYNEIYGFFHGDFVISSLASLAEQLNAGLCGSGLFIGHIGGDDFIASGENSLLNGFVTGLCAQFDALREKFYSQEDWKAGYIRSFSREGEIKRFPLMTVNTVIIPEGLNFPDFNSVGEFATNLKDRLKLAKKTKCSQFLVAEQALYAPRGNIRDLLTDNGITVAEKKAFLEACGELRSSIYEEVFIDLLPSEDIDFRLKKSIIYALGRMCSKKAQDALPEFTVSPNPHLRTRAVEALSSAGLKYIDRIRLALGDDNRYVRMAAIRALGEIGIREDAELLISVFNGSDSVEKKLILPALGRIGEKPAIYFLHEIIVNDRALFFPALEALSAAGGEETVVFLADLFGRKPSGMILSSMLKILQKTGGNPVNGKMAALLIENFGRLKDFEKLILIRVLYYSDSEALAAFSFLQAQVSGRERMISDAAFISLIPFSERISLNFISKYVQSKSAQVRKAVIEMLHIKSGTESLELLRHLLKDPDYSVRRAAAEAIIKKT